MSRVTSKLQVSIPKALAKEAGIREGDDLEFEVSGSVLILRPATGAALAPVEDRLALFDAASRRVRARSVAARSSTPPDRGWTREELYDRTLPR